MRPRERRETSEQDLFRSRLDQIIDMKHALVKLGQAIDWRFLEERFGAVYTDKPGQPPLPTRLMAGLAVRRGRAARRPQYCQRVISHGWLVRLAPWQGRRQSRRSNAGRI